MLQLFLLAGKAVNAQKTAAVTFVNSFLFTDSLGKEFPSGDKGKFFYCADGHRQLRLANEGFGKKVAFKKFQKEKYVHHTELYDFDSTAAYYISSHRKKATQIFRKVLVKSGDWKFSESTKSILGYQVTVATRKDAKGWLHRVYFTEALQDYKIRLAHYDIPGFVLRYEVESIILKGKGLEIIEARYLNFYDGEISFPSGFEIFDSE